VKTAEALVHDGFKQSYEHMIVNDDSVTMDDLGNGVPENLKEIYLRYVFLAFFCWY